jgi:hypothetical protein
MARKPRLCSDGGTRTTSQASATAARSIESSSAAKENRLGNRDGGMGGPRGRGNEFLHQGMGDMGEAAELS